MSTTRAHVLKCLRAWGRPVTPATLADWMDRSPQRVANCLSALYARDLVDRRPHPDYLYRYVYYPKALSA